ncbi:hypothetical protein [Mycobacterium nebraskense]|uniref:Uncharacterized protein n=1 Tax=Mycobacterium nebraskense TaxID=244292 RepID=A0A0F5NHG7_9MYCO|nr:hypothetical protein [Mycobacterium nebraskense]KKC06387.1 hypothetical protein WU83_03315 [Mycobacterium nebraskense]KLO34542.1 hypothetical protein ABW17_25760 [Mycobacterium nebraskense]MBI2693314.1 hypothetical protein [Mycobacterium nebraskense]MCV7119579.1 hypothetical protein [Mycobacterium nebraskense]ORW31785.1 hypothetical protein AWC17_25490 [Mycobacterium nebraskense]
MSWAKREAKALADTTLTGDALLAELEDYVRAHNPQLTDVRLERATATEEYDTGAQPPRRWYVVAYLADDGEGYGVRP